MTHWGFNQMCKALQLSSCLEQSFYALVYIFKYLDKNNNMLAPIGIKGYFDIPDEPIIPDRKYLTSEKSSKKITASKYNYYLNKCPDDQRKYSQNNLLEFLASLTEYLIVDNKINYEHFNNIKNRVKKLLDSNLSNIKSPNKRCCTSEELVIRSFFNNVFMDAAATLGVAREVDDILLFMQYNDRYAALTWILLFSLYPDNCEIDFLRSHIFNPFRDYYEVKNYITPPVIDCDTSSYNALCKSLAKKYKTDEAIISQKQSEFFDLKKQKEIKLVSDEGYEFCHLMFLSSYEYYDRNKDNKNKLKTYLPILKNAIKRLEKLNLDDENYWIEFIQLQLLKVDFYWKLYNYNEMNNNLYDLEILLYDNYEKTEKYKLLLAKLKRKQGIYFNRKMDFKNVLRTYSSSFFILDNNMSFERSRVKNNEAYMYRKWMQLDRCCQAYDTAINLRRYRESFDPNSMLSLYSNASRAYSYCHLFGKALLKIYRVYNARKALYEMNPNKYLGTFLISTKYYGETLLNIGIYNNDPKKKAKYFERARIKLAEIYNEMSLYDNKYSTSEYWEIYGRLRYYQGYLEDSLTYFTNAIKQIKEIESAEHRLITAYIYLGKIQYKIDPEKAFLYFNKAYKLSEKLRDYSYYRYTKMVSAFSLGVYLYLSGKKSRNSKRAIDLVKKSYKDIKILMKDSKSIAEKYKGLNEQAFKTESDCIEEFIKHINNNSNEIDKQTKIELEQKFLNFYVSNQ